MSPLKTETILLNLNSDKICFVSKHSFSLSLSFSLSHMSYPLLVFRISRFDHNISFTSIFCKRIQLHTRTNARMAFVTNTTWWSSSWRWTSVMEAPCVCVWLCVCVRGAHCRRTSVWSKPTGLSSLEVTGGDRQSCRPTEEVFRQCMRAVQRQKDSKKELTLCFCLFFNSVLGRKVAGNENRNTSKHVCVWLLYVSCPRWHVQGDSSFPFCLSFCCKVLHSDDW